MFKAFWKKYKIDFLYLFFLVVLASALRFIFLDSAFPGLWSDEAVNGIDILRNIEKESLQIFYLKNNGREGLFINIQTLFVKYLDIYRPWVLRLPSAIFGVLSVLGLYFLAKEIFYKNEKRRLVSFFSALVLASSFWHLVFSRLGLRAITAPFFIIWALYFLFLALRKNNRYLLFFSGLIYGLGFHGYLAYRLTPLIILLTFIFYGGREKMKKLLIFSLGALVTVFPLLLYFYQHPDHLWYRASQISIFSNFWWPLILIKNILLSFFSIFFYGDPTIVYNYNFGPQMSFLAGIFILISSFAYFYKEKIKKVFSEFDKKSIKFSFFFFLIAIIANVFSNDNQPSAIRMILALVPLCLLAGYGMFIFYLCGEKYFPRFNKRILAVIIFLMIFGVGFKYFFLFKNSQATHLAYGTPCAEWVREVENSLAPQKNIVVKMYQENNNWVVSACFYQVVFFTNSFKENNSQGIRYIFYQGPAQNLEEYLLSYEPKTESEIFFLNFGFNN